MLQARWFAWPSTMNVAWRSSLGNRRLLGAPGLARFRRPFVSTGDLFLSIQAWKWSDRSEYALDAAVPKGVLEGSTRLTSSSAQERFLPPRQRRASAAAWKALQAAHALLMCQSV